MFPKKLRSYHLKSLFIFLIILIWVFSGVPQIWHNPPIPPEVKEAKAAVSRVQLVENQASGLNPNVTVTIAPPTAGNLLVAIAFHRENDQTPTISTGGAPWNLGFYNCHATLDPSCGPQNSSQRRAMAVWWKIAGASEPTIISTDWSSGAMVKFFVQEFSPGAGASFDSAIRGVTSFNSGSSAPLSLSTGITGNVGAGNDFLLVTALGIRNGGGQNITSVTWNDVPPGATYTSFTSNGGGNGRTVSTAFTQHTTGGTKESTGSWSGTNTGSTAGMLVFAITPAGNTTTIGDGADPSSATYPPGTPGPLDLDAFTFVTSASTDPITTLEVTLPAGTAAGLSDIRITSDNGATLYYTAVTNPVADVITFSGGTSITANTAPTQYKVRITPKTHANMPLPPGASYNLNTSRVTNWTGTNTKLGSDTDSGAIIIDNLSPNGATLTSGSTASTQVTLNWTTSNSSGADGFSTGANGVSVILRWTASIPGTEVPTEGEGAPYTVGNVIGTATVACVRTADNVSTAVSGTDGTGAGGCSTAPLTNGQAYSYKVFQRDLSGNYDVGIVFSGSPFTPTPAPTFDQSAFGLFANTLTLDVGAPLAGSPPTLNATGDPFRLRLLIHVNSFGLVLSGETFKLQFAQKQGASCGDGDETYADVTAVSSGIAYNDNAGLADGAVPLIANANDPTHGTDPVRIQTYEELNTFTNSQLAIGVGEDGKWDFALKDNGAPAGTSYCFRAVKNTGSVPFGAYTVYPEIKTKGQYPLTGNYVSQDFDTGAIAAGRMRAYNVIEWDWQVTGACAVPSVCNLRLQIRTADTQPNLASASWCGPTNCTGSEYIGPVGKNRLLIPTSQNSSVNRWLQYRIFFDSASGSDTPILNLVRINYQ